MDAVELYPSEANLFDSVGEFYLAKEEKDKAVEYYKKALDIDPDLRSSKQALEKIEGHHTLDYLIKHTRVKKKN